MADIAVNRDEAPIELRERGKFALSLSMHFCGKGSPQRLHVWFFEHCIEYKSKKVFFMFFLTLDVPLYYVVLCAVSTLNFKAWNFFRLFLWKLKVLEVSLIADNEFPMHFIPERGYNKHKNWRWPVFCPSNKWETNIIKIFSTISLSEIHVSLISQYYLW